MHHVPLPQRPPRKRAARGGAAAAAANDDAMDVSAAAAAARGAGSSRGTKRERTGDDDDEQPAHDAHDAHDDDGDDGDGSAGACPPFMAGVKVVDGLQQASQYEYKDHTADIQIHSWGATVEECFAWAAIGMVGGEHLWAILPYVSVKAPGDDSQYGPR
jgi:hypothetical protein